jgi:hypothetical protein
MGAELSRSAVDVGDAMDTGDGLARSLLRVVFRWGLRRGVCLRLITGRAIPRGFLEDGVLRRTLGLGEL